jgi:hypothetical protein
LRAGEWGYHGTRRWAPPAALRALRAQAGQAAMTLTEAYVAYLRDPVAGQGVLVGALAGAGYALEAGLLRQARSGRLVATHVDLPGAWAGHRAFVGAQLPAQAAAGDIWLDTLEVMPMILVPDEPLEPDVRYSAAFVTRHDPLYAWLALRPVAAWQFGGFLALAPIAPRVAQVDPPFRLLDPARILRGAASRPVSDLTAGEARMYAGWFGKGLAGQYARRLAARYLPAAEATALAGQAGREWAGLFAEGIELAVAPATLERDAQEEYESDAEPEGPSRMLYGEWAHAVDIGARTSVLRQTGLFSHTTPYPDSFDNLQVTGVLERGP